jgi:DNA-binding CsgD family transcriptional regulator/N-acetylneuraminic acid mutarotase
MAEKGEALSERELDVLRGLAVGASNKEIADDLSISPFTVKTHLRNIFAKLGVSTRTEALHVALQQGLLVVPGQGANGAALEASDGEPDRAPAGAMTAILPAAEAAPDQPPSPVEAARRSRPGWIVAGALVLLALLAAAVLFLANGGAARLGMTLDSATPEPLFEEQPIGETRWLTSRPLPEPVAGAAAAAVGLEVYLIGGETPSEDGPRVADAVRVFSTRERTWREAAAKPMPVADAGAAELFGEIYVPGGRGPDGQPTDVVEAYSPTQDAWRRVAALPRPLAGALAVSSGGFLYVLGGHDGAGPVDTVYVYDPGADSWRPLAAMPAARAFATGDSLVGQIVLVGGEDETGQPQPTCFVYDPATDAWADCPSLLQPRAGAAATVMLNKLYVFGGTGGDPAASYGEVYDPNSRTWQVLNVPGQLAAWAQPGVARVENRIFALGGRVAETLSDENLIYAPFVYQSYIPAASSGDEEPGTDAADGETAP